MMMRHGHNLRFFPLRITWQSIGAPDNQRELCIEAINY